MMGITWEEAEMAAQNRSEWGRSVAQCIHCMWVELKVTGKSHSTMSDVCCSVTAYAQRES